MAKPIARQSFVRDRRIKQRDNGKLFKFAGFGDLKDKFKFDFGFKQANKSLIALVAVMLFFGLMMIASASLVPASNANLNPFHFVILQAAWLVAAIIIGYIVYQMPLQFFNRTSIVMIVVSIVLLFLVLLLGRDTAGAKRWIDLGPFDLQPTELVKISIIIYLSAWLSKARKIAKNFRQAVEEHFWFELLPFLVLLGGIFFLILLQPDLDTAAIIAVIALVIYFVSGRDWVHTLGVISIFILMVFVGIAAAVFEPYRFERVKTYLEFYQTGSFSAQAGQDSAYQVQNCLVALAEGGLLGVGYGQSRNKLYYLSNAVFTDSIFCVVGEEFGLAGSLGVLLGFLTFFYLGVKIAMQAQTQFASLVAMGVTVWITFQGMLNLGANLAVIPFGGIPLPFISYGGSSTTMIIIGVALLLNIHKHNKLGH
jgi:cell division protein FtsW